MALVQRGIFNRGADVFIPVVYSPYWEHVKQAWDKRGHPNFLFLFYEDLLQVRLMINIYVYYRTTD